MTTRQISEAACQEALRRGFGPRIADWFVRGAYAQYTGQLAVPSHFPRRGWYLDGARWAQSKQVAQ